MIKYAIGIIAAVLCAYGWGAFVAWNANPSEWTDGLRVFVSLVGLTGVVAIFAANDHK